MTRIDTETNIERLRQMARLLVKENDLLHRRLQQLTAELATARGVQADQLELELRLLKEQLDRKKPRVVRPVVRETASRPIERFGGRWRRR